MTGGDRQPFRAEDYADGLVPLEPGLWAAGDEGEISYPEDGNARCLEIEGGSFWFRHRNRCIVSLARRYSPGGRIWDIGGGNGAVSRALLDAGYPVALIEPGPVGARNARDRGVEPVIRATLEGAGVRPGALAAAGSFDVVEHLEDDRGFLEGLHTALRPGGRLYLTVPAHRWLWSSNDDFAGHFRRYTASTLRRALEGTGFAVDELSYFFAPLVLPVFLARSLPSRLGLRGTPRPETSRREHLASGSEKGRSSGWLARWIEARLERESRRLDAGRGSRTGTSLLAAATAR